MVSPIDRAALIEQAALVAYDSHFPNSTPDRSDLGIEGQGILATLPVIAKALFAPLREYHRPASASSTVDDLPTDFTMRSFCAVCGDFYTYPCPTVRLLDAIERDL